MKHAWLFAALVAGATSFPRAATAAGDGVSARRDDHRAHPRGDEGRDRSRAAGWSSNTSSASRPTTRLGRRSTPSFSSARRRWPRRTTSTAAPSRARFVGPLHCIPAIVKDNFETIGLQSAAGSLSLKGFVSTRDAFQVKRIKAAGAIVLAKSNMAEFAFTPYETVSSILPGYTKNPYALDRVTAGSSGGTAAAVAANFGAIGLGSDTGNSIRGPSSHQALAGIRSTMGLTSRAGVVPLSLLADIAGPMTRTLEDAVAVLQVIAGPDPDDPVTVADTAIARDFSPGGHPATLPNYLASLRKDGLKGKRIGILRQAYERDTTDAEIVKVFMTAVDDLKRAGAIIVDPVRVDLDQVRRQLGHGHVRRLQVRHQPLAGVTWRQRHGEDAVGDHPVATIPSDRAAPPRTGPGRDRERSGDPGVQSRVRVPRPGARRGRSRQWTPSAWTGSCTRRGATRRASSAT